MKDYKTMSRLERIKFLAEENRKRTHLRFLRERFTRALGREVSDHDFLPYDFDRLRPAGVGSHSMLRPEGVPEFLRYHLEGDFVEKNCNLIEAFGACLAGRTLLLETRDAGAYFPWLRVGADIFSDLPARFPKTRAWSRWSDDDTPWGRWVWFCVCDTEVKNGFCLREGTNWGMDDEYEGYWTLNVFGDVWAEMAEDLFDL